jgi:hypothetical protein
METKNRAHHVKAAYKVLAVHFDRASTSSIGKGHSLDHERDGNEGSQRHNHGQNHSEDDTGVAE